MVANFVNNQNSSKNQRSNSTTFDIRNFIDQLNPVMEKGKYICPVCSGHNLSIDEKTGKYQCFNGCECRDIREAIRPWASVVEERQPTTSSVSPKKPNTTPKAYKPHNKPVPIPAGELALARLASVPAAQPQPAKPQFTPDSVRKALLSKGVTESELEQITVVTYNYNETRASHRYQAPSELSSKGYEKTFAINRIDSSGKTQWNKGKYAWNAYRQDEAIAHLKAIDHDLIPVLLSHEGEKCVEAGRAEKLVGITSLGNSNEDDLVCILNEIKFKLDGRPFVLAHCQDNDKTGHEKAEKLAKACVRAQISFVAIDLKAIYPELCDKGDIVDILATGMTGDELAEVILKEIERIRGKNATSKNDEVKNLTDNSFDPNVTFLQQALSFLYGDKRWISCDNKLYYHTGTYYRHSPDSVERPKIASFCNSFAVANEFGEINFPYATPSKVDQVLRWVKYRFEINPELLNPPGLNCTNGIMQIIWDGQVPGWGLVDHSPDFYYTYEPICTYNPEADPKDCERLLDVLDKPQQEIFLRIIAASLDLATVRKHKGRLVRGLLLKGDGNNGKDSLREIVSMMYGRFGLTACTLSDFKAYDEGRKFPLSRLKNSRVNWATENANTAALDKLQSIKAFLTGDNLSSEGKGKDEFDYNPNSVGLFNVNDTPNLKGTLEAITSRWGILTFNKTFKIGADPSKGEIEADPRFKYDPEFLRTQVLPAFLNRVLQALVDLMRDGIDYRCTESALKAIQIENSHLFQFCQDVGLSYDSSGLLTAGEIWKVLEQWYQDNGTLTYEETEKGKRKAIWLDQVRRGDANVKGANQIIARFQQLFPKVERTVTRTGNNKQLTALKGISFSPPEGRSQADGSQMEANTEGKNNVISRDGSHGSQFSNPGLKTQIEEFSLQPVEEIRAICEMNPLKVPSVPSNSVIEQVSGFHDCLTSAFPKDETAFRGSNQPCYSPSPNDPEAVEGSAFCIRECIAEMSGEMIADLTQNWTKEFRSAVSEQLSLEDNLAVESLAPGVFPKKSPLNPARINPEQLPIPTVDQIQVGTQVWVFRVRDREWLPGLVEEIEERFNKPSLWSVRLTTGELLPARSLEQLRLR